MPLRTYTVDLDDALVARAMAIAKKPNVEETITFALQELLRLADDADEITVPHRFGESK
jgi:hypothetical protein